jgi:hypothetical protein
MAKQHRILPHREVQEAQWQTERLQKAKAPSIARGFEIQDGVRQTIKY